MSTDCDHEAIMTAFGSRRSAARRSAIRDAYVDLHADWVLSEMLGSSRDLVFDSVTIAAHLGDFTGDAGDAALRQAIRVRGPGTRDLRCASLLALAKRAGTKATPDLLVGLASSDTPVKDYAVIGLAGVGEDQAWAEVFDYLRAVLRRKRRAHNKSEVAYALAYLAQGASEPAHRSDLVSFVRKRWDAIDEAEWFAGLWPDAAPQGATIGAVSAPDCAAIRAWARDPLFQPLGIPTA